MSQETLSTSLKTTLASSYLTSRRETKSTHTSETKSFPKDGNEENIACCLIIADAFLAAGNFIGADEYFKKAAELGSPYSAKYELCYGDIDALREAKDYVYGKGKDAHANLISEIAVYLQIYKKTGSPRMGWEITRICEELPAILASSQQKLTAIIALCASQVDLHYKESDKYIRAFIDLHRFHSEKDYARFLKENPESNNYVERLYATENASLLYSAGVFYKRKLKDLVQAIAFLEAAAEKGDPRAHLKLGIYYQD